MDKNKTRKYILKICNDNHQYGGGLENLENSHSKRSICTKTVFDKNVVINEIYENNLLNELHEAIIAIITTYSTNPQLRQYMIEYENLSDIIDRIKKRSDIDINIKPLTIISYIKNHESFPPKMLKFINKEDEQELQTQINKYEFSLLSIGSIRYLMCSVLYDKYIEDLATKPKKTDNIDDVSFSKYLLKTIEKFDMDDISEYFNYFEKYFINIIGNIAYKLNICYLTRSRIMNYYLILIKTNSGIKYAIDLDKEEQRYLKSITNIIDEKNKKMLIEEIEKNIIDLERKLDKEAIKLKFEKLDIQISNLEILIIDTERRMIDKKHEFEAMKNRDDPEILLRYEKNIKNYALDLKDYKRELEEKKDEKTNYITQIERELEYRKKERKTLPGYKRYIDLVSITPEDVKEYREKITECIDNRQNILVPILLLDLTKDTVISDIRSHILSKDDVSVKIGLHANMLFINTNKKYIEYFEPFWLGAYYNPTEVYNTIKNVHTKMDIFKEYKFYKQEEICPAFEGPQIRDRSKYCYIHSCYYALLRMLYPDISSEELQMMLISVVNDVYKHDEKADTTSMEYLNRKYSILPGHKIKQRLERFMIWVREYGVRNNMI